MTKHNKTPIYDGLIAYKKKRIVSFDVPGHKQGKSNKSLIDAFGDVVKIDMNSSKPLDNLTHPISIIKEAEILMADAFKAKHAFLMVSGTTAAVQTMIFSCVKTNEEIIMPRNVHKSAINALVLCGAKPIYINPGVNHELGISLGMSIEDLKKAILKHPHAKAIFINNPTYYGICSNLKEIVKIAHKHNMKVLVDEAHGTHFYFQENAPISAMAAGADMAAVSIHKTGGSLTQSSILLINENIDTGYIRQIINLTQTTSASYILMASLDIARKELALKGKKIFENVQKMCDYAREEINKIEGFYAYSKELINKDSIFDFDQTKLSIHTRHLGLAGIEVYDLLRNEYDIQIEFGDLGNILAIISVGDRTLEVERLISALSEIKRRYKKPEFEMFEYEYIDPIVKKTPQEAFYANSKKILLTDSQNQISSEFVMAYPPGIPILAPGELITDEIIKYINYAKIKGCTMMGTQDETMTYIKVMED